MTTAPEIVTPIERSPAYQGYGNAPTSNFLPLAAGDFDGDKVADIALMNSPLGELQIYHGNGDGTFVMTQHFPGACCGTPIAGDFDGDGVQDLALYNGPVTVYFGKANGGMARSEFAAGSCPYTGSVQKGDFDGDGKTDLLLNCVSDLTVLLNAGGGVFRANPTKIAAPPPGFFDVLAIGDFNLDGRDDIAAIVPTIETDRSQPLGILFSKGDGTFRPRQLVPTIMNPVSMIATDFDEDGRPELLVADAFDGTLKALRNKQ